MQSQILLILFALNFSIAMQSNISHTKEVPKYQTNNDDMEDDINDTPSPEWIRYQQERFQHIAQQKPLKEKPQTKVLIDSERKRKAEETTARHEMNNNQQTAEAEEKDGFEEERIESEKINNENAGNAIEFPSIQGFIKFIKSIKQTWMKNSLLRIDDKIKMLQSLKDSLLKTIEKQFMILWQDDDDENEEIAENIKHDLKSTTAEARNNDRNTHNGHLRSKRGILDESSINFPPEAALMSINFLTFSVFLIKLVLQVVNIIKSKHYQLSTINMDMDAIRNG